MKTYESFTEAYVDLCRSIDQDFDFLSSPRGMKIKEKLGVQFRLRNPRARLPRVPARNFSLSYFVAETLWYLSGDNSTAWISRYAPFWGNISDDGVTANSAYGSRIFRPHSRIAGGSLIQWDYVKEELRRDPDSRRAVIHIRTPDDSRLDSKDVPCTLALQFFIRNSLLHLHVSMRSSDIILGLAYDVPAFTTMQEILASELGVGLGEYVHTSNSLHCYERDFKMLSEIAQSNPELRDLEMSPLPGCFPVGELFRCEALIREMSDDDALSGVVPELPALLDADSARIFADWSVILLTHRVRRANSDELARSLIKNLSEKTYHCFVR